MANSKEIQNKKIFHLVYRSTGTREISDQILQEILRVSRVNNQRSAVTGILLFREGHFIQLLEGEEKAVRQTLERIKTDPLHKEILNLIELTSEQRIFPAWSMGLVDEPTAVGDFSSFSNFVKTAIQYGKLDRGLIVHLLKSFSNPDNNKFWNQHSDKER